MELGNAKLSSDPMLFDDRSLSHPNTTQIQRNRREDEWGATM